MRASQDYARIACDASGGLVRTATSVTSAPALRDAINPRSAAVCLRRFPERLRQYAPLVAIGTVVCDGALARSTLMPAFLATAKT